LLLRGTAAAGLFWRGYALFVTPFAKYATTVLAVFAIACALLLLVGHLTRLAASVAAVVELFVLCTTLSDTGPYATCVRLGSSFTLILGVALVCLGPGLFSIDAQRYGRREIVISRPNQSSGGTSIV
jgi:uncharacterized membrane protein YphA (DoxX/SURF4 family)